jgi:hypothetical protein
MFNEKNAIVTLTGTNGSRVHIVPDPDAPNPRSEYDHLCTISVVHRREPVGDETLFPEDLRSITEDPAIYSLPVYAYIHSGIRLSCVPFSCPWDSGQIGIIHIPVAKMRQEFGEDMDNAQMLEMAEKIMREEVEEYSQYISGDVYGVIKESAPKTCYHCGQAETKTLDSCFGIFGFEFAQDEAQRMLNDTTTEIA